MTATDTRPATTHPTSLRLLQVFATLTTLNVFWQFVTAGTMFPDDGLKEAHEAGALVLHVVSFVALAAAGWHWRKTSGPVWPTVLAGVLFVLTFIQPLTGERDLLEYHVPGAMVLTVGAVWVMVWSFGRAARA